MKQSIMERLAEEAAARRAKKESEPDPEEMLMSALAISIPWVVEAVEDLLNPCMGLNVTIRPDGGYLAIMKRENQSAEQVQMAYGDSFAGALRKLNHRLNAGEWRKNKTWAERQAEITSQNKR